MKRQRGRGRKSNGQQNRNFESNGPDIKIRGSASHVYDKYQQLARDAASSGDRIAAESYLQHAEHYFRMMRTQQQFQRDRMEEGGMMRDPSGGGHQGGYSNGRDDGDDVDTVGDYPSSQPSHAPGVASGGPLDVVDPEAAEQPSQPAHAGQSSGQERQEREDGRSRRQRRQRRRYDGGGGDRDRDGGGEATATSSPSLDSAQS
jgi:hypothetical protein